jgi:type IV secretion system protein VirB1
MRDSNMPKTLHIALRSLLAVMLSAVCPAQTAGHRDINQPLTPETFAHLAATCAPEIPLVTLRAIARVESDFRPYALSLNYPRHIADINGYREAGVFLARQPRTLIQARTWAHYLLRNGFTVSIGLLQVNAEHTRGLGLTLDQLFDTCTNLKIGAHILSLLYQEAAKSLGEGQPALLQALSAYNSGSPVVGFDSGYVGNVVGEESDRPARP